MKENDFISWKKSLRWPGVEPGSTAWKAAMLTAIPPTLVPSLKLFGIDIELVTKSYQISFQLISAVISFIRRL